jgi:hypothetical protein
MLYNGIEIHKQRVVSSLYQHTLSQSLNACKFVDCLACSSVYSSTSKERERTNSHQQQPEKIQNLTSRSDYWNRDRVHLEDEKQ